MAKTHYKALLGKVLLGLLTEDDPVQAMLEWVAHKMMLVEAEGKVDAEKGPHSKDRNTNFSGARGKTASMASKILLKLLTVKVRTSSTPRSFDSLRTKTGRRRMTS